jgi:tetratricopeptide (TPR) repeat protein
MELARGNVDQAERAFLKAVAAEPKSATPLLALANLYETVGRLADAEERLRQALALEPRNATANATLATVLLKRGRPRDSEPFLKAATEVLGTTEASLGLADYYVAVGRSGEALALLERLAVTPDGFAAGRIRAAMVLYASGRREEAHAKLNEVLARDAKNASAMALRARFLVSESRFDEAIAVVNAALAADPQSSEAHFALAKIQLAKGAVEEARKAFLEVVNIDPARADARVELSRLHILRSEIDTAIGYAEAAVKSEPDALAPRLALTRALTVRPDDLPKADAQLKILQDRYPNSPEVHTTIGRVALQRENTALARRWFERALQIDPDYAEALSGLTALDAEAGKLSQARARVEARLAAAKTASPDLLLLAAKIYLTAGDLNRTEQTLRRLIDVDPANLESYNLLGQFYVAQRRLPEATREFATIARREPKSVTAQTMLGLLAHARGDLDAARQAYEAAVRSDSRAAAASNNLAWLYANTEGSNLDLALELAQTARSHMPTSSEVADTLAFVYYKKQMGAFALPLLEQALQQEPQKATYHYHLGLVHAQAGQDAKARKSLEAALKLDPKFGGAEHARRVIATLVY